MTGLADESSDHPGPSGAMPADFDPPSSGNWSLTFVDDFDEPTLDESKWNLGYGWGNATDKTEELMVPENVRVEDGTLRLLQTNPNDGPPYHSGAVNTKDHFAQRFGYFEVRTRLPAGAGFNASAWAKPEDGTWPPELLVVEHVGSLNRSVEQSASWREQGELQERSEFSSGPDFTESYHVFGCKWEPERVDWYVDGDRAWSLVTDADKLDVGKRLYLTLSVAIGTYWSSLPDETTTWPASMDVDWVRVWERTDQ